MKSLSYVFGPNETTTVSNANSVSLHCLVDRLMEKTGMINKEKARQYLEFQTQA